MSTKFVNSNNLETLARGLYDKVDTRLDGRSFKYLTLVEYEKLSDAEKNRDDIVYQITDKQLSYNDLVDKPTIPSIEGLASEEYVMTALGGKQLRYVTSEQYEQLTEEEKEREDILYQITDGELSYNDLVDKPDLSVYATKEEVAEVGFSGDYNDLINTPCYDKDVKVPVTVTFDGTENNIIDTVSGTLQGYSFQVLKISNASITREELIGAVLNIGEDEIIIGEEDEAEDESYAIERYTDGTSYVIYPNSSGEVAVLAIPVDTVYKGFSLSSGLWVMKYDSTIRCGAFTLTYNGTTIDVKQLDEKFIPDTIARADHIHDYNDLTNKPCYDNREISTKTVRFDGNIDQNKFVDIDIFKCLKISDDIIHMDDLINKSITLDSGVSQVITEEMVSDLINNLESGSGCLIEDLYMFFLYEESVLKNSNGTVLPAGVWITNPENWAYGGFTLTCDVTEGELKQLDEKFIPNTIARVDNIYYEDLKNKPFYDGREYVLKYNGNKDDYESITFDSIPLLKLSDKIILRDDILSVTLNGVDNIEFGIGNLTNTSDTISGSAYAFLINKYIIYIIEEEWTARDDSSNIVTIPTGIWLVLLDASSGTPVFVNNVPPFRFKLTLSSGDIKQLDEKFIPDTIARKSDAPNITIITQAEYDAIEGTDQEDSDTFYLISDEL